jgi:hypothetical protein
LAGETGASWLGFIELFVVFGFALVWGSLELLCLRLDRQKHVDGKPSGPSDPGEGSES